MSRAPSCTLYHASENELPIGRVLRARTSTRAGFFERWVDDLRPKGASRRVASWFMGENPIHLFALGATSLRHIYRVEPVGSYFRGDASWLIDAMTHWDEVEGTDTLGPGSTRLIRNFWSGRRSEHFGGWEIVAEQMRVCSKLTERERRRIVDATDLAHPGFIDERIQNRMIWGGFGPKARPASELTHEAIAREMGIDSYPTQRRRARKERQR